MKFIRTLLDLFAGYKTYVIATAMFFHGVASVILNVINNQPVDHLSIVEAGAGLATIFGRRATDR